MQIIPCLALIVLISSNVLAQLDNLDVIHSEMNESMEKFALGQTLTLLSAHKDFNLNVATKLVGIMNDVYGREWLTLIGTNLHTTIIGMKLVNSTFLLMEYKENHVLLVRQELDKIDNNTQVSLETVIERAKSASVQQIASTNPSNFNRFANIAKQVLSNDYKSCDKSTDSKDIKNWCYRLISQALVDAINTGNNTRTYSATVGNNNRCFSETLGLNITEAHIFTLDSIYFEIRGFYTI